MKNYHVNRKLKDSLFRMIFKEKKELLSLYNAINDSNYTDAEQLTVCTLEDSIYMGMKNDVSFLVSDYLVLYEAQSTWNPNMPLRGLFYFAELYQGYVAEHQLDIYSTVQLKIPNPIYVVFYNGIAYKEDVFSISLSDAFIHPDQAVDLCIQNDILADFLRKHRAEVRMSILNYYDEELHIKTMQAIGYDEGLKSGIKDGILQSLMTLLQKLGPISQELKSYIMSQDNPDILLKLLEFASAAKDLDEFITQIKY